MPELEEEEGEDRCESCEKLFDPRDFWIACDLCEKWYCGRCGPAVDGSGIAGNFADSYVWLGGEEGI